MEDVEKKFARSVEDGRAFPIRDELRRLADALLEKGDELRVVGGSVRNFLLNQEISDLDLACKYQPSQTMKILKKSGITVIPTGIKFGTVTAIINRIPFEITALRKDIKCDGRHAEVEYSESFLKDAQRRDFTINAMSMDFDGNIYDYFNGMADLKNGVVRFVGNAEERVVEDGLRILRFFRFLCSYGDLGKVDQESFDACKKYRENIDELSCERIRDEMLKILALPAGQKIAQTIQIMKESGVMPHIMTTQHYSLINPSRLKQLLKIENLLNIKPNPLMRIIALLGDNEDSGGKMIAAHESLADRWRLSNKQRSQLARLAKGCYGKDHCQNRYDDEDDNISLDMNLLSDNMDKGQIKRALLDYDKQFLLDKMVINTVFEKGGKDNSAIGAIKNGGMDDCSKNMKAQFEQAKGFMENYEIPNLPINGADIMDALQTKSGKEVGVMLKKCRKYWIENDYKPTKEILLEMVVLSRK